MLQIRPFNNSEEDYAEMYRIHCAIFIDFEDSIEGIKHTDTSRAPHRYWNRHLGEVDGKVIGGVSFCETWWNTEPNQYHIFVWVDVPEQGKGYGDTLFKHAINWFAKDEKTVASMTSGTREDFSRGPRFLEARGFKEKARYPRSELDVTTFDDAKFAHYRERLAQNGLIVKPLSEIVQSDPEWQRKMWNLEFLLEQDEPHPTDPVQAPLEEYIKDTLENPAFDPACVFIALDGDHFAGISQLWPIKGETERISQGWTGVDRPYRKKGLATALKLYTVDYARQVGTRYIRTDNNVENHMYQINLKMGFEDIPAWIDYEKKVDDTA